MLEIDDPEKLLNKPAVTMNKSQLADRRLKSIKYILGIIFLILMANELPTPWVVEKPGGVIPVTSSNPAQKIIDIKGATTYPDTSRLSLTTVALYGSPEEGSPALSVIGAWNDEATSTVIPQAYVFPPDASDEAVQAQNIAAMSDSQMYAQAAAIEYLGYKLKTHLEVVQVINKSPEAQKIQPKDMLERVRVQDRVIEIESFKQLISEIREIQPDTLVELELRRGKEKITTAFKTLPSQDGNKGSILGLGLRIDVDLPFPIKYKLDGVGGPSAGIMFSLGIIDELTPGPIAGTYNVAGTGEITESGQVLPIGGIRQKMLGAKANGNTVFLAPKDNCEDLLGNIPEGIDVYIVSNVSEAVSTLESIANGKTPENSWNTCSASEISAAGK